MLHAEKTCEEEECLLDGEIGEECQLLGHVANERPRDGRTRRPGLATKDSNFARVGVHATNDALEKRRLAAATGSEKTISAETTFSSQTTNFSFGQSKHLHFALRHIERDGPQRAHLLLALPVRVANLIHFHGVALGLRCWDHWRQNVVCVRCGI